MGKNWDWMIWILKYFINFIKYRLSIRAAKLYEKNNSFDPVSCKDIPRFNDISEDVKVAGVPSVKYSKYFQKPSESWSNTTHPISKTLENSLHECVEKMEDLNCLPPIKSIDQVRIKKGWQRHFWFVARERINWFFVYDVWNSKLV